MSNKRSSKKKGVEDAPEQTQTIAPEVAVIDPVKTDVETAPEQIVLPKEAEKEATFLTIPEENRLPAELELDFSNSFILTEKGNLFPIKLEPSHKPVHESFQSDEEILELILKNRQTLFAENTLLINERKGKHVGNLGVFQFDLILFDFRDMVNPKLYFGMITKPTMNDLNLFFRITDYFTFLRHPEATVVLHERLAGAMDKNEELQAELQGKIGSKDIAEFIGEMLRSKPNVLLIMEEMWQNLEDFMETYADTWGEMVKPMEIHKFTSNGENIVRVQPGFDSFRNGKKKKADKVKRSTEAEHFIGVSEDVREAYRKIKSELLTEDNTLLFSPKNHYISLKKNRIISYFHIGKKKINLVVMNSFVETNKHIKHHEVKTLTEKVQKFWGGACCTIVVEDVKNLGEVIDLLKKLINE